MGTRPAQDTGRNLIPGGAVSRGKDHRGKNKRLEVAMRISFLSQLRWAAALLPVLTPTQLSPGSEAPPQIVEYVIPRPGNFPHDPAVAADGTVWYTDQRNSYIGKLNPESGAIVDYPTPTPGSGPHGLTVAPDGSVWYTGQGAGLLGRLDPKTGK